MTAITMLPTVGTDCALHGPASKHRPRPFLYQEHHVVLQSWTQKLGLPDWRKVSLCGTGHDNVHAAIRDLIAGRPFEFYVSPSMKLLVDEAYGFWLDHRDKLAAHAISGLEVV